MIIDIPFQGFYHSLIDSEIDNIIEHHVLFEVDEVDYIYPERDNKIIERIEEIFDRLNWRDLRVEVAKLYVEAFQQVLDNGDLRLPLQFDELISPREYNFQTDRIICKVGFTDIKILRNSVPDDVLEDAIKARHTSRNGFISLYTNQLKEWEEKPLVFWDHNETGTLLRAYLEEYIPDWEHQVENELMEGDELSNVVEEFIYAIPKEAEHD